MAEHDPVHNSEAIEMPGPTVAPLVLAAGMTMLASGLIAGPAFLLVGGVILLFGLGLWISHLRPGKGHIHEPLAAPDQRPQPIKPVLGTVTELRPGMPGYRVRLPEKVHPISAGIKGGLIGGLVLPIPALIWGLVSGHGLWYPVNLLAGMVLPGVEDMDLEQFHASLLLVGAVIHVITCLILGMIYGVLMPSLPPIPQAMAWGALLAPLVWTAATFIGMGIVNPGLRSGISWPWFIVSQFIYGVAMTLVVIEATGLSPIARGMAGGLLGGVLMPLPALIWSLGTGKGFFYPVNLLAGMAVPGITDPADPRLFEFHADWMIIGVIVHIVASVSFGVACALLLPTLRQIPSPFAWGALMLPALWTGASYSLMGVVNPVLQDKVDWPWFIASQFVFGIVAAIVVMRTEQVEVPPAGRGVAVEGEKP